jgi:hypothetical protein
MGVVGRVVLMGVALEVYYQSSIGEVRNHDEINEMLRLPSCIREWSKRRGTNLIAGGCEHVSNASRNHQNITRILVKPKMKNKSARKFDTGRASCFVKCGYMKGKWNDSVVSRQWNSLYEHLYDILVTSMFAFDWEKPPRAGEIVESRNASFESIIGKMHWRNEMGLIKW